MSNYGTKMLGFSNYFVKFGIMAKENEKRFIFYFYFYPIKMYDLTKAYSFMTFIV